MYKCIENLMYFNKNVMKIFINVYKCNEIYHKLMLCNDI